MEVSRTMAMTREAWCDVFACQATFTSERQARQHTLDTGHVTHLRIIYAHERAEV